MYVCIYVCMHACMHACMHVYARPRRCSKQGQVRFVVTLGCVLICRAHEGKGRGCCHGNRGETERGRRSVCASPHSVEGHHSHCAHVSVHIVHLSFTLCPCRCTLLYSHHSHCAHVGVHHCTFTIHTVPM